jgi:signal transduction histidine kinase
VISQSDLPGARIDNDEWKNLINANNTAGMSDILLQTRDFPYGFSNYIITPGKKEILYCDWSGGALRHFDSMKTIILDSMTYLWHTWQGDTLWICNEANGLVALHYPEYTSHRFLFEPTNPNSISSDKIRYILFTPDGNLWIATENGLNYYDKASQRFSKYSEKNGLCNNSIYCMAYDLQGRIWLGTGNGLSCFDTATKTFSNFYPADGLINSEYNRFSACLMPNGYLYMGGTEGIDYFKPSELIAEAKPPPVIISDFSLHNIHYLPEHLPNFNHESNNVTIAFTAVDYAYPEGNKYLYKLEGINKDWVLLQGSNSVNYPLLPPGHYTFKVKAANHRGVWNDEPATLSFTILPAWYNTWWFYFLCALLAGAMVYYFIKRYTQSKLEKQKIALEKQQAVELERLRISSELHDDLGGGLSSISLISELTKTAKGNDINNQLNKISDSSKDLVQKMNEIVWALNINNDNLQSLLAYIRQYAVKYLDDVNIGCTVHMPENIPAFSIAGNERRSIFLMVKECINNIIKHSKATQANIEISLAENICIKISDNGIGFAANENEVHHFGLQNLKQRVKQLNGNIEWTQNNGTIVNIQIPLKSLLHKSGTSRSY